MAKTDENKWTRERSYWEKNGAEIGILAVCVIFGFLMIGATVFVLTKPEIPGLSTLFKAPPPPPRNPMDQKLNLAPGEQEILLFNPKGKPLAQPQAAPKKP